MQPIENIILDLGGVLLNLSYPKTEAAFSALGLENFHHHFSQFKANPLFEDLETGKVSPAEFLAHFRRETGLKASDDDIFAAWNAMLLDFPAERVQWLRSLPGKYRVFLYSNTNAIHYDSFQANFAANYPGISFDAHFETAYYSHILGRRKPYVESYLALLQDAGIEASRTLFIDDTLVNIEGALAAGLQALHLEPGKTVLDIGV